MFTTTFSKYCLWIQIKISMTFFLSGFFFHRHWQFTGQQGKEEDHLLFHSTTFPHSQTFRHIFQLCMSDNYHTFMIALLAFTRLLLDKIYHFIKLPLDCLTIWCFYLLTWRFDSRFSLQQFETGNWWTQTR